MKTLLALVVVFIGTVYATEGGYISSVELESTANFIGDGFVRIYEKAIQHMSVPNG